MTAHTRGLRSPPVRTPGDSTTCHNGLSLARKVPAQHIKPQRHGR
jgi:hypothetical protein